MVYGHVCVNRLFCPGPSFYSVWRVSVDPEPGNWLHVLVLGLGVVVLATLLIEIRQTPSISHLSARVFGKC